jgi:16S rRNA (guanine527-N7)-methyltransferase
MTSDRDEFVGELHAALEPWKMAPTPEQLAQMFEHYQAMVAANRTMNLTRITEPADAAIKHYADSLASLAWARDRGVEFKTLLDIGTGAGFPAVPLAVMAPHVAVTALDGTAKKIEFLRQAAVEIGLTNLRAEHAHSEHWPTKRRFDLVVARAVGPLDKCVRAGARFLKRDGWLVAYKTTGMDPMEVDEAEASLREFGLRAGEQYHYELNLRGETLQRLFLVYSGHH